MKFEVWHVKQDKLNKVMFGFGEKGLFPDDFEKVAEVEGQTLDEVFRLTNNIDKSWHENSEVKSLNNQPYRSTSVGDIIINIKKKYRVDLVGFIEEDL